MTSTTPPSQPLERLLRPEQTMVRIRWAAVPFALLQVLTFYQPYPEGVLPVALALVVLLAVANVAVWAAGRRVRSVAGARRLSLASLTVDFAFVMALVFAYTFDADTAMWAIMYFLPLEGAIRFQLSGAMWTMVAAAAGYTVREAYGAAAFGHEFLLTSITFRTGIGFIIAVVAGAMASTLVRERDQLEVAKAELEAANQIKDDFIAVTNHELRTPLTTILGYTTMLGRRWGELPDDRRQHFVGLIDQQGRRLLGLVEDLLTSSSAQAGALDLQLRPVGVRGVVDQAITNNGEAGEAVRNRCMPAVTVVADEQRLGQALTNYVSNALKYGQPPVEVRTVASEDRIQIRVIDHGTGVPGSFVPRLFEKFSQAAPGGAGGSGLGLAIVRQLVEAQGGSVWYERLEPHGSQFCLSLPRGPDARPEAESDARPGMGADAAATATPVASRRRE